MLTPAREAMFDAGRAEEKINTLTSGVPARGDPWRDANGWALDAAETLKDAMEHLTESCVVGVLERCGESARKSTVEPGKVSGLDDSAQAKTRRHPLSSSSRGSRAPSDATYTRIKGRNHPQFQRCRRGSRSGARTNSST